MDIGMWDRMPSEEAGVDWSDSVDLHVLLLSILLKSQRPKLVMDPRLLPWLLRWLLRSKHWPDPIGIFSSNDNNFRTSHNRMSCRVDSLDRVCTSAAVNY
jgi:hypothetical protein